TEALHLDAGTVGLVKLVEANVLASSGRVELHGYIYETEANGPGPHCAGHGSSCSAETAEQSAYYVVLATMSIGSQGQCKDDNRSGAGSNQRGLPAQRDYFDVAPGAGLARVALAGLEQFEHGHEGDDHLDAAVAF